MVRFEIGDLLRMPVPAGRYDLVLCRNTVIYFTRGGPRRAARRGWSSRWRPAATWSSARPSASPIRARWG